MAHRHTIVVPGLSDGSAIRLLAELLGAPFEIAGAVHLQATAAAKSGLPAVAGAPATLIRLEGFGPSVAERRAALEVLLGTEHNIFMPDLEDADRLWRAVRDVADLVADDRILWRLSLPATDAAVVVAAISKYLATEALYDWGGSLVWLALPPAADAHAGIVRASLPSGHATLMRAPPEIRARIPVFQPQPAALAALSRRVKAAFDPQGVLSPRFMDEEA